MPCKVLTNFGNKQKPHFLSRRLLKCTFLRTPRNAQQLYFLTSHLYSYGLPFKICYFTSLKVTNDQLNKRTCLKRYSLYSLPLIFCAILGYWPFRVGQRRGQDWLTYCLVLQTDPLHGRFTQAVSRWSSNNVICSGFWVGGPLISPVVSGAIFQASSSPLPTPAPLWGTLSLGGFPASAAGGTTTG